MLIGWLEGHPGCKILHQQSRKFFWHIFGRPDLSLRFWWQNTWTSFTFVTYPDESFNCCYDEVKQYFGWSFFLHLKKTSILLLRDVGQTLFAFSDSWAAEHQVYFGRCRATIARAKCMFNLATGTAEIKLPSVHAFARLVCLFHFVIVVWTSLQHVMLLMQQGLLLEMSRFTRSRHLTYDKFEVGSTIWLFSVKCALKKMTHKQLNSDGVLPCR